MAAPSTRLTVADFLSARIADDEAAARAVPPTAPWEPEYGARFSTHDSDHAYEDTLFVTRFDPTRVLAECEAKRRIVEAASEATGLDMQVDGEFGCGPRDMVADPYLGDVLLRALAVPYADHPDFDPAWRP